MKKTHALVAAALMAVAGLAFAAGGAVAGKIVSVEGDVVTIQLEKGKAGDLAAGAAVEIQVKQEKEAPKKGADALQGC